jgi:putative lipoic acid-binding regulatory protein
VAENGSGYEFPCEIPVKVFGRNEDAFREAVIAIVKTHFPDFDSADLSWRLSRQDRYMSLTISLWVEDRASIDALYTELSGHETVLMLL